MRQECLPTSVSIYITFECYLSCPHCFLVQTGKINKYCLPYDSVIRLVDEAFENNVYMLIIAGGEPLLHPQFDSIIEYIKSKKIIPLVACTGINLSNGAIQRIKELGIPTLQVSIDGKNASTHDAIRGKANFDEVCDSARRIVAAGLNLNIALCIHKLNFFELNDIFVLCYKLNAYSVKLAFYSEFEPAKNITKLQTKEHSMALAFADDFCNSVSMPNWIICPGYDLKSRELAKRVSSAPSLVIFADGNMAFREDSSIIGHISSDRISKTYTRAVNELLDGFYHKKLEYFSAQFCISSISSTSTDIHANALIYKHEGAYHIVVNSSLSGSVRFFSILHEIGHVATGTLCLDPRREHSVKNEFRANAWALEQIRENIHPDAYYKYDDALNLSESELYLLIDNKLHLDMVNFY